MPSSSFHLALLSYLCILSISLCLPFFFNTCSFISLISFFCNILSFLISPPVTPLLLLELWIAYPISSWNFQWLSPPYSLNLCFYLRDHRVGEGMIEHFKAFLLFEPFQKKKNDMIYAWIEDDLNYNKEKIELVFWPLRDFLHNTLPSCSKDRWP